MIESKGRKNENHDQRIRLINQRYLASILALSTVTASMKVGLGIVLVSRSCSIYTGTGL